MHSNELTILLYHGVTESESIGIENYSGKHVQSEIFRQQMEDLSKNCNVLSMDQVVELYYSEENYPEKAVAVTFDDGFRNNFTVAAPILKDYAIPATFYITSGIVNTDIMFWVDILEDCINLSEREKIEVNLDGKKLFSLKGKEAKIDTLIEIKKFCKSVEANKKNEVISQVLDETRVMPSVTHSKNYEKISWKELLELSQDPLFTIGGHSMYHDILSSFESMDRLSKDISLSIDLLDYNLQKKVCHYAYPEGQYTHYNETVIQILKANGIICSPSAVHVRSKISRFIQFKENHGRVQWYSFSCLMNLFHYEPRNDYIYQKPRNQKEILSLHRFTFSFLKKGIHFEKKEV